MIAFEVACGMTDLPTVRRKIRSAAFKAMQDNDMQPFRGPVNVSVRFVAGCSSGNPPARHNISGRGFGIAKSLLEACYLHTNQIAHFVIHKSIGPESKIVVTVSDASHEGW